MVSSETQGEYVDQERMEVDGVPETMYDQKYRLKEKEGVDKQETETPNSNPRRHKFYILCRTLLGEFIRSEDRLIGMFHQVNTGKVDCI